MSCKIQLVMDEQELNFFRAQAQREAKTLSSWIRDSARAALQRSVEGEDLHTAEHLRAFFDHCDKRERGTEPDWEQHKLLIGEGARGPSVA